MKTDGARSKEKLVARGAHSGSRSSLQVGGCLNAVRWRIRLDHAHEGWPSGEIPCASLPQPPLNGEAEMSRALGTSRRRGTRLMLVCRSAGGALRHARLATDATASGTSGV